MNPTIYRIDFPDGQFYVGATVNFSERRRTHVRHARQQKAVNRKLQAAFNENKTFHISKVASGLSRETLHLLEQDVIAQERPTLNINTYPTPLPTGMVKLNGVWVKRAAVASVGSSAYQKRRSRGWSVEDALTIPLGQTRGETPASAAAVCSKYGVSPNAYYARRHLGWSVYEALGLKPRPVQEKPKVQKRMLTYNDTTMPLDAWAKKVGIKSSVLHSRLSLGWSVERALTEPKREKAARSEPKPKRAPKVYTLNGVTGSVKQLSDSFNVPYTRLYSRIKAGWPEKYWLAAASFPIHSQPDVSTILFTKPANC